MKRPARPKRPERVKRVRKKEAEQPAGRDEAALERAREQGRRWFRGDKNASHYYFSENLRKAWEEGYAEAKAEAEAKPAQPKPDKPPTPPTEKEN